MGIIIFGIQVLILFHGKVAWTATLQATFLQNIKGILPLAKNNSTLGSCDFYPEKILQGSQILYAEKLVQIVLHMSNFAIIIIDQYNIINIHKSCDISISSLINSE